MNIYKSMSLPLKVSLWYFICVLFSKGLSFISTPIFTRIMSTEDYGITTIFRSWYEIVVIFTTFGLSNSVFNVGLVKYDNDKDHFQSSLIGLEIVYFTISSSIFLAFYNSIYYFVKLEKKFIVLMLIFCLSSTLMAMWTLRMRLEYNYRKMAIINLLNVLFSVSLSVLFVIYGNDKAFGKVTGTVIATSLFGLLCIVESFYKNHHIVELKYWKFAIKYNTPMIPHFLSLVLLNQLDRIMIQNMIGIGEAGIYSVAYNSAGVITVINSALSASYNPWLLQRLKDKNYDKIKEIVNVVLLMYMGLLAMLILFAPEIIKIMAPVNYYEGIYAIPPVACSMFFVLLFNLFAPVEHFSLKTKFIGIASIISAIANILLNYIFIGLYGYLAAGYTTLVCYIIYAFAHWLYMKKCCCDQGNITIFDDKRIVIMAIAVCFIAIVSTFLYRYIVLRYVLIFLIVTFVVTNKKVIVGIVSEMRK